jgi:hypothetical protein
MCCIWIIAKKQSYLGIRAAVLSYTTIFAVPLPISGTSIPILTQAINAVVVTVPQIQQKENKNNKIVLEEGSSASVVEEKPKAFPSPKHHACELFLFPGNF